MNYKLALKIFEIFTCRLLQARHTNLTYRRVVASSANAALGIPHAHVTAYKVAVAPLLQVHKNAYKVANSPTTASD
jgi:hypothetical protein